MFFIKYIKILFKNLLYPLRLFYKFNFYFFGDKILQLKKINRNYKYNICFDLGYGWNSLDGILPLLTYISLFHKECYITVLCFKGNAKKMMQAEPARMKSLYDVADEILISKEELETNKNNVVFFNKFIKIKNEIRDREKYLPELNNREQEFVSKKMKKEWWMKPFESYFKTRKLDAFLMTADTELIVDANFFHVLYPKALFFYHSPCAFCDNSAGTGKWAECPYLPFGYYFLPDYISNAKEYDIKHHDKYVYTVAPRLDPWWIDYRKRNRETVCLQTKLCKQNKKIVVCVFSELFSVERFDMHEKKIFHDFLCQNPDFYYIFKFHPRNSKEERNEFIEEWVPSFVLWEESNLELIQLAYVGNLLLIVGQTTAAGEVLTIGIPVISFYNSYKFRDGYKQLEDGSWKGVLEIDNIIYHADDLLQLNAAKNDIFNYKGWKRYRNKIEKYLPKIKNSCEYLSNFIINKIEETNRG